MSKQVKDELSFIAGFFIISLIISYWAVIEAILWAIGAYILLCIIRNTAWYKEWKAQRETQALYEQIVTALPADRDPDQERIEFGKSVYERLPLTDVDELNERIALCICWLYDLDFFFDEVPKPPIVCNSLEGAQYRDYLREIGYRVNNRHIQEIAQNTIVQALHSFLEVLPPLPRDTGTTWGTTPLNERVDSGAIEAIILPFYSLETKENRLFKALKEQLDRNLCAVSGLPYTPSNAVSDKMCLPADYAGEDNVASLYLAHTPLLDVLETPIPFTVPQAVRFEHHWLVAPPGRGKTTALSAMLSLDLDSVAAGEASVIVMDSNRDFIQSISKLARFGPGGDLEGKLVFIDVEDTEYPIALNLFDLGIHEATDLTSRDREVIRNSTISMMDYIFRSVLGTELTSRQSTLFNFSVQLLLEVPGATLDTLIRLMKPGGKVEFNEYIQSLEPDLKRYFDDEFDKDMYRGTKNQVIDRIYALKRNRTLSRMFSSPETKLNLYKEMSVGKVILVNSAKSLLQEDGVEIFGRFFIALVLLAAEKRQLVAMEERMPTFLYIDEAQDIISRDEKLPTILDQARKLRVGAILSHQRIDQVKPFVSHALLGSTAIKMASAVSASEASLLAKNMRTTPQYISEQAKFHFATFVNGQTESPLSLSFPEASFDDQPRMDENDRCRVLGENRKMYCVEARVLMEEAAGSDDDIPDPLANVGENFD